MTVKIDALGLEDPKTPYGPPKCTGATVVMT